MAKSPEDGLASLIRNLEEKTGKSIDAWVAIARGSGKTKHKEIVDYLKAEHGLGHGYANQVAHAALAAADAPAAGSDDLVEAQYSGPKAGRPPDLRGARQSHRRRSAPTSNSAPRKPT